MKWGKKIPEYDVSRNVELLESDWTPLREPKNIGIMILMSFPIMIVTGTLLYLVINLLVGIDLKQVGLDFDTGIFTFRINPMVIFGVLSLAIFHEFIHLIFIPDFIKSRKTTIGINVFIGFVYTEEIIRRKRFLIVSLAPLVVISVLLPLILVLLGILTEGLAILVIFNGAASSVDILNVIFVLIQVPKDSVITSNGNKTYWKNNKRSKI